MNRRCILKIAETSMTSRFRGAFYKRDHGVAIWLSFKYKPLLAAVAFVHFLSCLLFQSNRKAMLKTSDEELKRRNKVKKEKCSNRFLKQTIFVLKKCFFSSQ